MKLWENAMQRFLLKVPLLPLRNLWHAICHSAGPVFMVKSQVMV